MAGKPNKKPARSVWSAAGKSVEDLLKMGSDYNRYRKLSESTLRKVVNRLASAGNKRLRRMEQAGESSPAYREVQASGGKFSTKGKTLEGLRREFLRAKQFFEDKTSSLQFWKQVKDTALYQAEKDKVVTPPAPQKPAPAAPSPAPAPPDPVPPTVVYDTVDDDGGIRLESGNVLYMDTGDIINPETGEVLGNVWGSSVDRNKYAVDENSKEYKDRVGDMWDMVDDLVKLDNNYKDRAFRYILFDNIEGGYLASGEGGATLEEIRDALSGRVKTLYKEHAEAQAERQRHGVSSYIERR